MRKSHKYKFKQESWLKQNENVLNIVLHSGIYQVYVSTHKVHTSRVYNEKVTKQRMTAFACGNVMQRSSPIDRWENGQENVDQGIVFQTLDVLTKKVLREHDAK